MTWKRSWSRSLALLSSLPPQWPLIVAPAIPHAFLFLARRDRRVQSSQSDDEKPPNRGRACGGNTSQLTSLRYTSTNHIQVGK
mmetsp:Transcript_16910/g.48219  ORF Transcript_16910/g.48219 Transcript_16910/m.48219 type:complete len:83 (-) Transcript_16910:162-410(-)